MKIEKVYAHNIRSLTEHVELDFKEDDNFIRIGGRNGRGKSTIMTIGLKILLGLTPAKPHLTKGCKKGHYIMENGRGTFGVEIYEKGNPTYSYTLINGERDSSRDTLNHNRCLPVIRANIGFDIDEENTGALNINENTRLNFVSTNGRTDLAFLKNQIYSEEIEILQEDTKEIIKSSKNILDRNSTEISLLIEDRSKISIIDKSYLNELINYTETIEIQEHTLDNINDSYLNIIKHNLILKNTENNIAINSIDSIILGLENITVIKEWLDIQGILRDRDNIADSLEILSSSIFNKLMAKSSVSLLRFNELNSTIEKLRGNLIDKVKLPLMKIRIDEDIKLLKEYIYFKQKLNKCHIDNTIQEYGEFLVNLKNMNILKTSFKVQLGDNIDNNLKVNLHFLNRRLKEKSMYPYLIYSALFKSITRKFNINEEIERKEEELSSHIYKDGRCVLCLKEK